MQNKRGPLKVPHSVNPGLLTVKLPRLKHHEALLLSLLADGEKTAAELKHAILPGHGAARLLHQMRRFQRGRLVKQTRIFGRVAAGRNGNGRPFYSSSYALAAQGRALLTESIEFYRDLDRSRSVTRVSVPRPDTALTITRRVAAIQASDPRKREGLSPAQFDRLLKNVSPEFALVLRALHAGLQAREIISFDRRDVPAPNDNTLSVECSPGNFRSVPLTTELRSVIADAGNAHKLGRIFDSQRGKRWSEMTLWQAISKTRQAAHIPSEVQPSTMLGEFAWPTGGRSRPRSWRPMTNTEEQRFLKCASAELSLFYRACQRAGLHWQEVASLTWPQVDFENSTLRTKTSEGTVDRVVDDDFYRVLKDAASRHLSGRLFLMESRQPWSRHRIYQLWTTAAQKIGLPKSANLFKRGRLGQFSGRLNVRTTPEDTESAPKLPAGLTPQPDPVAKTNHVQLFLRSERPIVDGKMVPALTEPQYRTVHAILSAPSQRLSKDELIGAAGSDAVNVLKRLSVKSSWKDVIQLPRNRKGAGYGIA